jgi:prepilin-type N-terminal cleavage/methylation domain-containing protein
MKLKSGQGGRRGGFTLIELLVVIAIIAILVGLTAGAVMRIWFKGPEIAVRKDLTQLSASVGTFLRDHRIEFGQPPSRLLLRDDGNYSAAANVGNEQLAKDSHEFLKKMFPACALTGMDWNNNGAVDGPAILSGQECLVFFLGGIGGTRGFSANPANPTDGRTERIGPAYTFETKRLATGAAGYPVYNDPWGTPYAFFSSYKAKNGYNRYGAGDSAGAAAYVASVNGAVTVYVNPDTVQIISAGKDKAFGSGTFPGGVNGPGEDDYANFSGSRLGAR